jgi:hypothetical protein
LITALGPLERHALDHVGIQRALHQEADLAELVGLAVEHSMKMRPMILRFCSGSVTPSSAVKNSARRRRAPA